MPCGIIIHPSTLATFVRSCEPDLFNFPSHSSLARAARSHTTFHLTHILFASSFVCQHRHCMILAQPFFRLFNPPPSISAALEGPCRAHELLSVAA
jgi:hypothetical protein